MLVVVHPQVEFANIAAITFRAIVAADQPNGLRKGQELTLPGRLEFGFRDGAIAKITDIS